MFERYCMRFFCSVFLFLWLVFSQSFGQTQTTGSILNTKQEFSKWERQVLETEKNIRQEKIKTELIRSEIIFFVSLPFSYLFLTLLYGDGGSERFSSFPTGYSVLTTEIAYYKKVNEKKQYGKNVIQRPKYHKAVFNATEVYVILLSLIWSFTIAFNNLYESLIIKSILKTELSVGANRVSMNFFTRYF